MKMHHQNTLMSWVPSDALELLDDELDNDLDMCALRFVGSDGVALHDPHLPVEEFEEELYV